MDEWISEWMNEQILDLEGFITVGIILLNSAGGAPESF